MSKTGFDLESTEAGDAYELLSGLVVPRPIRDRDEEAEREHNLAPYVRTRPRFEVARLIGISSRI